MEKDKSPRWYLTYVIGALAGAAAAAGIVVFLYTDFARADDVEKLGARMGERVGNVTGRVNAAEKKIEKLESAQDRLEEDYHFQRDQLWEIAKSVGANRLPAPKH